MFLKMVHFWHHLVYGEFFCCGSVSGSKCRIRWRNWLSFFYGGLRAGTWRRTRSGWSDRKSVGSVVATTDWMRLITGAVRLQ